MKILIADDDRVWRRLLEATLTRLGHEVTTVVDGTAATAALLAPDGPRMAILDWMMPGADGLTVCRAVRQRQAPYVYIILLTSRDRSEDMVAGLDAEADDYLTKPFDTRELTARLRSGQRILKLQEGLLLAHEILRYEAKHDRLTGLWNRGMILDQLGRELSRASREHAPLSVIVADIDRFKKINDTHGHPIGDTVIQRVAHRMRSVLRDCDYIGRHGGEEFMILLPGCDCAAGAEVAERIRLKLAKDPVRCGDLSLPVSVSLGVASTLESGASPDAIIASADEALYRAKADGRNQVALFGVDQGAWQGVVSA